MATNLMNHKNADILVRSRQLNVEIANCAEFNDVLDYMVEIKARYDSMMRLSRQFRDMFNALSERATAYAFSHPSFFSPHRAEVRSFERETCYEHNGLTFKLHEGRDGIRRANGEALTNEFIEKLPAELKRVHLAVDTTAINRDGVSDKELAKYGLVRGEKRVWSWKAADAADFDQQ